MKHVLLWTLGPPAILLGFYLYWKLMLMIGRFVGMNDDDEELELALTEAELTGKERL